VKETVVNMQGYNLILLYDINAEHILMCKRRKEPYLGLYNLIGGKIEPGEDHHDAAYRELYEETSVSRGSVKLIHLMDFTYYLQNCYVEVYVGKLKCNVSVSGDENELFWSDLKHNFLMQIFMRAREISDI
jgi:8-oxo-dGTP diphosphatase